MLLWWTLVQSAVAQDFTLTVQPDALMLVPGQAASFVVYMTPLAGFSTNVTLSVGALPAGVTADFSPDPVTPPGTSLLTLTATTNAAVGAFTLNVTGVGGGITNTTASSVTVNFGLLPLCTGGFTGIVTDEQTGLPVPGAYVVAWFQDYRYSAPTDTNGMFNFSNVSLAANNAPALYYVVVTYAAGYWNSATSPAYAVCDATNRVNLQILRQHYGSISGHVTVQGGGPAAGVTVNAQLGALITNVVTDTNGGYQFTGLSLNDSNAPANYTVTSQPAGDWRVQTNILVQADSNAVANLVLVPICYATVTGSVVYGDTRLPAANATVRLNSGLGEMDTNADENGIYTVPGVALNHNNSPLTSDIQIFATGYFPTNTTFTVSGCGVTAAVPMLYLAPTPRDNYGAVSGHVYDVQTGLPLTNADVFEALSDAGTATTDAMGAYLYTNAFVGTGTHNEASITFGAAAPNYYPSDSNVVVYAGQTASQDFYLLRKGYGFVEGTARDSATLQPLTNVLVEFDSGLPVLTDTNGHYFSGPLDLDPVNAPTLERVSSKPPGYYRVSVQTTITNGVTNIVDLNIIRVCTGATIVGNVVNALTQQPITNAIVHVNDPAISPQMTDAKGNFILTNITVGDDNSPIQVTVNATAPGFNPQSHTVTIFCNATIDTEFGAPQTVFAAIQGYVTNTVSGLPLAGVFIGSEFGEAATTDTNGFYEFSQAPLGANNSTRTWNITAIPTNFNAQTLPVTVSSNAVSILNFGFGQPLAHLLVTDVSAPNPVIVGSNLVYTITLTNSGANAANVQLSDQLAPTLTFITASITNPPGGSFTAPVYSRGVITTSATNLGSNQSLVLVVTAAPTVSGSLTNKVTVASSTPDTDATGAGRTATDINAAATPTALDADLSLFLTAQPNPVVVSNQITYSFFLTNSGPADAPQVVLDDLLAANSSFLSASNSQGSFTRSGTALHWDIGTIPDHGSATASLVIVPLIAGPLTNSATLGIGPNGLGITDTNQANNTAVVAVTVVNAPPTTNVAVQALGPIVFNPQTGLFQQTIQYQNLSATSAAAVRISIPGLPPNIVVYNASGSINGAPYVEYDQPVAPGGTVNFLLEYYTSTRAGFVSSNFTAAAIAAPTNSPGTPSGTVLQLDRPAFVSQGELTLEFASTPGATYVIRYSSDLATWKTAVPPIIAVGTRVQWIDGGPPKTDSPPGPPGQRFYRVVQTD